VSRTKTFVAHPDNSNTAAGSRTPIFTSCRTNLLWAVPIYSAKRLNFRETLTGNLPRARQQLKQILSGPLSAAPQPGADGLLGRHPNPAIDRHLKPGHRG
jgi:hypothetical protein